jgi:hypothetical protein
MLRLLLVVIVSRFHSPERNGRNRYRNGFDDNGDRRKPTMKRAKTRLVLGLACAAVTFVVQDAMAEEIKCLRTYYFGNSFTGNTMPGLHSLLGESSGKEWTVNASTAPGVPLWAHMKKQMDEGPDYAKFQRVGADTDAIVMLIFGGDGLSDIAYLFAGVRSTC